MVGVVLLAAVVGVPSGTLVDQVIAVVDKEVVTQSELLIEARIALAEREGEDVASGPLAEDFLQSFRDYLINQRLIAEQARRLGGADVAEEDVNAAMATLQRRFRSNASYQAFLRRFGIAPAGLRTTLRRSLRNERYMRERLRLRLMGQGSAAETEAVRYDRALRTWIDELRAGAEIRLLGPDGELERQSP